MSHNFRGKISGRRVNQRRRKWSQDATRNPIILEDQFGRKYSASSEQRSGHPTGHIAPLFTAPWYIASKYYVINPDNVAELYLNTEQAFRDAQAANANYHKRAVKFSSRHQLATPIRGEYSDQVIEALGEPPTPVQPIVALHQRNKYILGSCEGCQGPSNECVCAGGYRAPKPDPRLVPYMRRRREELEEVTEGLDFSEASRQRALRDAGLAEVVTRGGRRIITDLENVEGMDFSGEAPEVADDFNAPKAGADALEEPDAGADEPVTADDEAAAQTEALSRMQDDGAPAFGDDLDKAVTEIEEQVGDATPRTPVPPRQQERVARQAPRPANQSAARTRQGAHRSRTGKGNKRTDREGGTLPPLRSSKDKRPSLADGARPVVGAGSYDED